MLCHRNPDFLRIEGAFQYDLDVLFLRIIEIAPNSLRLFSGYKKCEVGIMLDYG